MELPLPTVVLKTCGSLPRKQSPAHSVAFRSVSELGETKAACWSHSNPTVTGCFPPEEGRTEEVESRRREQQSGAPLRVFWGEGAPRPGRQLWSAPVHGWKVPIALLCAAQGGPTNTCSAARFTPKLKLPDPAWNCRTSSSFRTVSPETNVAFAQVFPGVGCLPGLASQ